MDVKITGTQEIINALGQVGRADIILAANRGLQKAGMDIIYDAQQNLRRNNTNDTSLLAGSGKVVRSADGEGYDVGFMSGKKNYAGAVEFGRKPGKLKYYPKLKQTRHQPPPGDMLEAWAYRKLGKSGIGWALAWRIGARGTKPQPFFEPAIKKNRAGILQHVRNEILKVINRNV